MGRLLFPSHLSRTGSTRNSQPTPQSHDPPLPICCWNIEKVPVCRIGNAYVGVKELILYAFNKVASSMSKFNLGMSRASSKICLAVAMAATPVCSSYHRDDDSGDRVSILSVTKGRRLDSVLKM